MVPDSDLDDTSCGRRISWRRASWLPRLRDRPVRAERALGGLPQLSRTPEIFSRFLEIQTILGPEIEARGGRLRAGLYTRRAAVDDVRAKLAEMRAPTSATRSSRRTSPSPRSSTPASGGRGTARRPGYTPAEELPEDARARLPSCTGRRSSSPRGTRSRLVRDPRTQQVIADQLTFVAREGVAFDPEGLPTADADLRPLFAPYLEAFRDLPADVRERAVLYMTVGSLNKDARGMMTDGESLQVTAGPWAIWAISDMWMLTGSTTWLESQDELDRLLPPYKQWQRRAARWVRKVI